MSFPELEVNSGFLEVTLKLIIAFEIESLEILFLESFTQELNRNGKANTIIRPSLSSSRKVNF